MPHTCPHSRVQRAAALVAALFGVATLFAGGRILLGVADAGYYVVRPVLLFNTTMGAVYLVAAVLIARDLRRGLLLARLIAIANVLVLVAIVVRRVAGGPVANETVMAMTLRTVVWTVIAVLLSRVASAPASSNAGTDHRPGTSTLTHGAGLPQGRA